MISKYLKKMICSLLAVLMVITAVPINAIAFELEEVSESIDAEENVDFSETEEEIFFEEVEQEAETLATTPAKVNDAVIEERITKLKKLKGKYFTVSGNPCAYISGHGCSNCGTPKLIKLGWIKDIIGILPDSINRLPEYHVNDDFRTTQDCRSCRAFASIAHWFIYAQKSTDTVKIGDPIVSEAAFNATTMKKAKKGDILAILDSSGNHYHSVIFLECVSGGIKVLDCNWNGSNVGNCKVQEWTMLYSSKHYSKVTISRATNYDSNEIPVTGISLNYSTKDLSVGDLFQLTATITPSNATNKNVTWSSGNSYIATVSTSGLVEAKTPGYVVITAKSADGQKTTNCGIWVDIYKVEYDTNGGTGGPTMQFKKKGETLVLSSSVPTKEGYVFAYWSGSDGVNYLPGSSYYQNKHLKLTAVWKERSPTITLDSFECTPNCTTGFNVYIENNDATENLSFDFDFVYDKTAFEIESIETFFPEDGVVSVNGDNVKYDVVNGETSAFSGMFAKVVLKIKDAEIKDYVFTIKVNRWVNGLGNVEPKIVDGIITMNHSACVVHYYSPVECALPEDEVYEYGDEIIIADAPEDEDWEFIYWSDDNGIKYYPGEKVKLVDSSFYLQANWKPKWTPVITVENASGAPGETIVIPVNITNNLHSENTNIYVLIYTGNAIYQDFEGVQGLPVNGNIGTIYVKIPENAKNGDSYIISAVPTTFSVFEENGIIEIYEYVQTKTGVLTVKEPEKEYTVTFDLGKGTGGPEDITVTGNEFTIPEEIPTRENWIFLYWFDDEGMYKPGETYTISKDKELVACWAPAWDPEIVVGDVLVNPGDTVGVPIYIYNAKEPENTTIKFSVTSDTFTRTNYEYASEIPEYGYLMTAYFKIPEDAEPGSYPVIFNLTEYNISSAYYLTEIVKIINGSITVTNQKICTVTFDQNDGWEAYIDKFEEGTSLSFKDIYFEREGYTAECLRITEDGKWGPRTYLADKNDMIYVSNDMEIKTIWRNNSVEYPTISSKEIKAKPGDTVTVQVETSFKNGFDFGEYLLQWENDQNINLKSSYNCSGENENNIIYEFVFEIGDDVAPGKHSWSFSIVEAYTPEGELWAVKDIPITISVEKSNYGDLNGDKEVNIKDAYLARLIAAKLITATEVQSTLGDVDLDGKITAIDANLIRKYVVKLIDSLPIK